jgi:anti-sigma-K factor RskA
MSPVTQGDSASHMLTGAYALDALDDVERRRFERHLADCADCAQEVAELRATSARLGGAVAEAAPERIKATVLAEIAGTRQEAPRGHRPRVRAARRGLAIRLTSAAAVVALAAAGVLGGIVVHEQNQLDDTRSQLSQAAAQYAPVAQVLAQPDAQVTSGPGENGGKGTVMYSRTLGKGVFMPSDLPRLPTGEIYQAWVMTPGVARSVGLVSAAGAPLPVTGLAPGASDQVFGLTVEPAGGSKTPTGQPVVEFPLPV